jgi:hypothetical protein
MDKIQKSLINTYLRKRKTTRLSDRTDYEWNYWYKTDKDFDISELDIRRRVYLVSFNPELIDILNKYVPFGPDTTGYAVYVSLILVRQPQLADKFDLSEISGLSISDILETQPKLVHQFGQYLYKLDSYQIRRVLIVQPQLIDEFDLDKLDNWDISAILFVYPQLINHFSGSDLSKLEEYHIKKISEKHPELAEKINNICGIKENG